MTELASRVDLLSMPPSEQVGYLTGSAVENFYFLKRNQHPNRLLTASVLIHDDDSFDETTWPRDLAELAALAIDPDVAQYLPEEVTPHIQNFGLEVMRGTLMLYEDGEAWDRLHSRPYLQPNGYYTIDFDRAAPSKFYIDGSIFKGWSHHQPDAQARVDQVAFAMIREGLPLLEPITGEVRPIGEILQTMMTYQSQLKLGHHECEGMWERGIGEAPISTIAKYIGSGKEAVRNWSAIEEDSRKRGYTLTTSKSEIATGIIEALAHGRGKAPFDYTDPNSHPEAEDVAQLTVASENNFPLPELRRVLDATSTLERKHGYIRFKGDGWKKGESEAQWHFPEYYVTQLESRMTKAYALRNQPHLAKMSLHNALVSVNRAESVTSTLGRTTELWYEKDGLMIPNNNDLAWARAMLIRSYAAVIAAIKTVYPVASEATGKNYAFLHRP